MTVIAARVSPATEENMTMSTTRTSNAAARLVGLRSLTSGRAALPIGLDLAAPGGIDALLAFHRGVFGDAKMSADPSDAGGTGGGDGTGGGGGDGGGSGGSGGDGQGGAGGGSGGGGDDRSRSQRSNGDADSLRADLARERAQKRELETRLADREKADDDRRKQSEAEETRRVREELETKLNASTSQMGDLRAQMILRDARDVARKAGVPDERWGAFAKHVDLSALEIGTDGTVPAEQLQKAIDDGLAEVPEFKTTGTRRGRETQTGSGAGAGAQHDDIGSATAASLARMQAHLGLPVANGAS